MRLVFDKTTRAQVQLCVDKYKSNIANFDHVATAVHDLLSKSPKLRPLLHSTKYRVKDPGHLAGKLKRKFRDAISKGSVPEINADNLFEKLGDLAGVRLLFLRTEQVLKAIPLVTELLGDHEIEILEGPFAYTWDTETRNRFEAVGVKTQERLEMYTSVHIVAEFNQKNHWRCEIQMRTLMEEVWGEVSHLVDYPQKSRSVACQEQLKVLARVASGGTRLVDSIFASRDEFDRHLGTADRRGRRNSNRS